MTKSIPRNPKSSSFRAAAACAAVALALLRPAAARAEETNAPAPAPDRPHPPAFVKTVEGHIGIATPLVTVSSTTTSIGDQFTLLTPLGIGFYLSDDWIFDFETVVSNPIHPTGTTGLVVDPGILYGLGQVALGLRVAFQINHDANAGLIPLLHVGLADLGGASWFAEADFPTFYSDQKVEFNTVVHTGIGF